MRRRLRLLLLVGLGVLLVLVVLAAVLPFLVDVDRYRPEAEARLSALLGRPVTLGTLRLSLWTGVAVHADRVDVAAPAEAPPGTAATLTASGVDLRPALLPLLRGTLDLRGIAAEGLAVSRGSDPLLRDGRLRATLRRSGTGDVDLSGSLQGGYPAIPGSPAGEVAFDGSLEGGVLDLRRLRADLGEGFLDVRGRAEGIGSGRSRWTVEGSGRAGGSEGTLSATLALAREGSALDFTLDMERMDFGEVATLAGWAASGTGAGAAGGEEGGGDSTLRRLRGKGTLRAKTARFAGLELTGLTTALDLDGGVLRLRDTAFDLYGGRERGTLVMELLRPGVPFSLDARLEGVDAKALLAAWSPGSDGIFRGRLATWIDVRGEAYAPEPLGTLSGRMELEVRDGALTTVGLLEAVAQLLEVAGGRGIGRDETPFRRLHGTFDLASGVARTRDLAVVSEDLALSAAGSVDLRGPLGLEGTLAFSPEVSAAMVRETSALRVRQGSDGRLTVPLEVKGTLNAPSVGVDLRRIVREGVRDQARHEVGKKLSDKKKELLDRLLGR